MGKSFTSFRDHGFWSRDSILEAWLRCVALHLDKDSYQAEHWLHGFRDNLLFASSGMCNGRVSACLDQYVTDETRVTMIVAASDRAVARLKAFGSSIPASFLNALGIEGSFSRDLPLSWFEDMHDTFNSLLLGYLTSDAATSRVLPYPPPEESNRA